MSLLAAGSTVARYTILGRLATGGMSELYLARQAGPSGFTKILVLKVILPQLAEDPQFVRMFHNEAKLAALINHPGVAQIFDFGVEGKLHYMAMEYIDGRNLNRILRALIQSKQPLPVPIALRIVADAAGALDFAHGLTDPRGVPLQIIHRDVSLENILCTYTGQVKLIDFGIAKARTLESSTTQGTLKGKYNYMAPELIEGLPIDHRVDIYALGVVLYRLIAGQLPFAGEDHAELLHRIMTWQPKPPRLLRRDIDSELNRIVMQTLLKDRDRRYQHAAELQADLESYLERSGTPVMSFHLAQFLAALFPPGTDEEREAYQQLAGTPHTPLARARPPSGLAAKISPRPQPIVPTSRPPRAQQPAPVPRGALDPSGEIIPAAVMAGTAEEARPDIATLETQTIAPEQLQATAPRQVPPTGPVKLQAMASRQLPPTGPMQLQATMPDELQVTAPDMDLPVQPSRPAPLRRLAVIGGSAILFLALVGTTYLIMRQFKSRSAGPVGLDAGAVQHDAQQKADGSHVRRDTSEVDQQAERDNRRPAADSRKVPVSAGSGSLSVRSLEPAEVLLDGKRVGTVPLNRAWPAGKYRLAVRSAEKHFLVTRTITVEPGRQLDLKIMPRKGQLKILVRPWATVSLDGERLGTTPLAPASAYEGPHLLELENSELGVKKKVRVTVRADKEEIVKVRLDE